MDKTEQRIINAVDASFDDLVDFFRQLIQCRSFSGQEAEVADLLVEGLRLRGWNDVEIVRVSPEHPNVLARVKGAEDGPTYIFNGHLDVIPPQDADRWPHQPFAGVIEDGKLYGRGTVDMKSGTFSSFFAGLIFQSLDIPIRGEVLFTGVCDELINGDNGVLYLIKEGYIKRYRPDDFGINCEPTNILEMNIATKGVYRVDITVLGKGAFNARPYLGVSAIDKASKLIQAIIELDGRIRGTMTHPLLEPRSVCVAMISGGEASNTVPDKCKLTVTRRMYPCETQQQCYQDYVDILECLSMEDPEFRAEILEWDNCRPPAEVPCDLPIIDAFRRAQKLVTGKDLLLTGSEGGTDASHVVALTGIPMPVYGPGDYKLLGTPNECVSIEDFLNAVKIYALTIYYTLGMEK